MNPFRKWIRNLFGFSGNEINGFLVLIPLMVLTIFSEPVYHTWVAGQDRRYDHDMRMLDSLVVMTVMVSDTNKALADQPVELHPFDPNHSSPRELRQLGFPEISTRRIAAYRAKGGGFSVKSDLLKIYGLDSSLYKRLYDYINLPSHRPPNERAFRISGRRSERERVAKTFDINTADTLLLKTVYGIGPVLAMRIIKFRDALGGFVRHEQLYEVYGLDSAVVLRLLEVGFISPDFIPEKLNINTADEKKLSAHPYIRRKLAEVLISYRLQHGDFMDINDIKKLTIMRPEEIERLLPYLKTVD